MVCETILYYWYEYRHVKLCSYMAYIPVDDWNKRPCCQIKALEDRLPDV